MVATFLPSSFHRYSIRLWRAAAVVALAGLGMGAAAAPEVAVKAVGRIVLDDNLFMQERGALAERESWSSTFGADVLATWGAAGRTTKLGYTPEITWFHQEPAEDFMRHRFTATSTRASAPAGWDFTGSVLVTDGPNEPVVWREAGGAPAGGGPAVRDRRDATVYRARLLVPFALGTWTLRPVASGYLHDFGTVHRDLAGCQNLVDRSDRHVGLDAGRAVRPETTAYLGYRRGQQDQARALPSHEAYDNGYHRLLGSVEGRWWPGARGTLSLGPEWRRYSAAVPGSFGRRDRQLLFVDLTVKQTFGPRNVATVTYRQFEQPGFSGRSTYEDHCLEANWRHTLAPRWALVAATRAQRFQFRAPVLRDDWVRAYGATLAYTLRAGGVVQLEYLHEEGDSHVPATPAREYTRNLFGLSLEWALR